MYWLLKNYQILWRNERALRSAFLVEVAGMFITNLSWLAMLLFFVHAVPGTAWSSVDILALHGINTLAIGLAFSIGNGAGHLSQVLRRGEFDRYALRPRSLLLVILSHYLDKTVLADIVFGSILLCAYWYLAQPELLWFLGFLSLLVPVGLIMMMVSLTISSLTFYFPDEQHFRVLFRLVWQPSFYPLDVFSTPLKIVFSTIMPALLVAGWPVEGLRTHSWELYFVVWSAAVLWVIAAVTFFSLGVRRYEGGNSIG